MKVRAIILNNPIKSNKKVYKINAPKQCKHDHMLNIHKYATSQLVNP